MRARLVTLSVVCAFLIAPVLGYAALHEGDEAPDFTVESLDHEMVSLSDWAGNIMVLDLFACWCGPCHGAAPLMEKNIWQVYKDRNVVVWGIDVSPSRDTFEDLANFKEQHNLTYPLAMDVDSDCWKTYSSGYVPTTYVIDFDGIIRLVEVGYHERSIIDTIEEILSEQPKNPTISIRLDKMSMEPYYPGDTMELYASVTNPGDEMPVIVYIALWVPTFGEAYFWPSYTTMMEGVQFTLPKGLVLMDYLVESIMFNDTFPQGSYTWYAVLANPLNGEWLCEPSSATWTFGAAQP